MVNLKGKKVGCLFFSSCGWWMAQMIVDLFQELWICFFLDESWLCMLMCLFPTFQHGFPTTSQISHIFCVAFNLRFSQGYTTSACWNENSQVLKRLRNHGKSNGLVPFSKSRINNKSRAQQRLLALDGDHGVCCQRILPKCKGMTTFFNSNQQQVIGFGNACGTIACLLLGFYEQAEPQHDANIWCGNSSQNTRVFQIVFYLIHPEVSTRWSFNATLVQHFNWLRVKYIYIYITHMSLFNHMSMYLQVHTCIIIKGRQIDWESDSDNQHRGMQSPTVELGFHLMDL